MKESFIPVAIDVWYDQKQRRDDERDFFFHVAQQGHYKDNAPLETRQGIYILTADGTLLASNNRQDAESILNLMDVGLTAWSDFRYPDGFEVPEAGPADSRFRREPPEGGVVIDVFTRIVGEYEPPADNSWTRWGFDPNQSLGRDHLWITREDVEGLAPSDVKVGARYPLPPILQERMLRFHLVDNVRGEPMMWRSDEVRRARIDLVVEEVSEQTLRLRIEGEALMQALPNLPYPDRRYDATLLGYIEVHRDPLRVSRFDLMAVGEAAGEGHYTRRAPAAPFTLAIAMRIAPPGPMASVPPQAARHLTEYMEPRAAV